MKESISALLIAIAANISADADSAYQAKHYERAAQLYEVVVQAAPRDAQAWYRLGVSDAALSRRDAARIALDKALALGYDPMSVHYRIATIAAAQGDAGDATAELREASAARAIPPEAIAADPAFINVAKSPSFMAFVDEQQRAFHPCRYGAAYRSLDFWIGSWTVSGSTGPGGASHVEAADDGCAILETWSGAYGEAGKSLTSYDAVTKQWKQHYVSGRGVITEYTGTVLPNGSLQFIAGTAPALTRMTYSQLTHTTIRQYFESSSDAGKTWLPAVDLLYTAAP